MKFFEFVNEFDDDTKVFWHFLLVMGFFAVFVGSVVAICDMIRETVSTSNKIRLIEACAAAKIDCSKDFVNEKN